MGEAHRRWSNTPPGAGKRVGSQRRGCRLIAGQGPGEAAATPGRCGPGRSATDGSCFSNPFQKANDRVRKSWRQNSCPAPCWLWQSATGRLQALGPAPGLARCSPGRRVPSTHCGGGAKRGLPSLPRFSLPVSRGGVGIPRWGSGESGSRVPEHHFPFQATGEGRGCRAPGLAHCSLSWKRIRAQFDSPLPGSAQRRAWLREAFPGRPRGQSKVQSTGLLRRAGTDSGRAREVAQGGRNCVQTDALQAK